MKISKTDLDINETRLKFFKIYSIILNDDNKLYNEFKEIYNEYLNLPNKILFDDCIRINERIRDLFNVYKYFILNLMEKRIENINNNYNLINKFENIEDELLDIEYIESKNINKLIKKLRKYKIFSDDIIVKLNENISILK